MSVFASPLLSSLLISAASLTIPVSGEVAWGQWEPAQGDRFVVDTQRNQGYLVHENGQYTQIPVATGQKRTVYYIGRVYNATTPVRDWEVRSKHIKGDRWTFGPTGRFLRLYDESGRTAYGIHEFAEEDVVFAREDQERFASMGCVLVESHILDVIEKTYALNGDSLIVKTRHGIEDPVALALENLV